MSKKEFNVFFIEDPARDTVPFRIATISRWPDGGRIMAEDFVYENRVSKKGFALIRLVLNQLQKDEAELRHPFDLGAHVCIIPEGMTVDEVWHRDAAVVVRQPFKADPVEARTVVERTAAALLKAEQSPEARLKASEEMLQAAERENGEIKEIVEALVEAVRDAY